MANGIPTIHEADAASITLPVASSKPTSLTGQTESSLTLWESSDGHVQLGVWECSPGTFTATRDGYDEVAQILFGMATITTDEGQTCELGSGSVFVTPSGWSGTWTIHETIRKTYVIRTIS
ncbi:unannotated protein [freshwater metagenome]|nr:DUF861 domain-containing protein [Actinomycetota bacterium]